MRRGIRACRPQRRGGEGPEGRPRPRGVHREPAAEPAQAAPDAKVQGSEDPLHGGGGGQGGRGLDEGEGGDQDQGGAPRLGDFLRGEKQGNANLGYYVERYLKRQPTSMTAYSAEGMNEYPRHLTAYSARAEAATAA